MQELANRFSTVAQAFCAAVDSAEASDKNAFLMRIYRELPRLIEAALQLPQTEPTDSTESDASPRLSHEEWKRVYDVVAAKTGEWDCYWQVFDPTKTDEPVAASLADDIADIYRDLSAGIVLNRAQQCPPQDIIWDWRTSFYTHWGKHAIDAMQAIHSHAFDIQL